MLTAPCAVPPAEEGADSAAAGGGGDPETPFIPGMGPEDRVEPPAGQAGSEPRPGDDEGGPPAPPGPPGPFRPGRPHWRFASHWNERWMHHDDKPVSEDRGQSAGPITTPAYHVPTIGR